MRAYQRAERPPPPPPMPIAVRAGRAVLRDYGGSGRPAVFVPSLINPPSVLDLSEHNSLLRWLVGQGVRPLLLDWGAPEPGDSELDIAGHIEQFLIPLLGALGERVTLVGYCLGGTMALAAALRHPVSALALIAAPWRFSGYLDEDRADLLSLWQRAEPATQAMGVLPMEVLQSGFWRLDPQRTIAKFEQFARLDPRSEKARGFVALEDWANDGPPLTMAAGRELLRDFIGEDPTGQGRWHVAGGVVDPAALNVPLLDIVSTSDRIVPAASSVGAGERLMLSLGHVGMIVGGRARDALWKPLASWLSQKFPS